METRSLEHEVELNAGQHRVFDLLMTPSDIRQWWGADRVIVTHREGGVWVAAWGDDEDSPEYVAAHRVTLYDPPRRLELDEIEYYVRSSKLPFAADFLTTFTVELRGEVCVLRVRQDGFPTDPAADEFYESCAEGWRRTLVQIRSYVEAA